ncbi:UNVERIFIED_CONTAM: hypothetical protein Sradi_5726800 [Sesamum radiatum]|uniref:Retrotransposon gag domain-containing protein n=1 Tax=Sesamum radiatum TaxID=300843 RepID=A0AAW2L1Z3_SESRA
MPITRASYSASLLEALKPNLMANSRSSPCGVVMTMPAPLPCVVKEPSTCVIGSFQEFHSLFLHQFASSRKVRKTELSLFAIRQGEDEPLKEYLQRFNTAALEVPAATQGVKANAFSQGLLDGDFFESLAKKSISKFDALLARATKCINMEEAQVAKKDNRGEKHKEVREEAPSRKPVVTSGRENPLSRG